MTDLEIQRKELIEHIRRVFPKKPRGKGKKGLKLVRGNHPVESVRLRETFEGKSWEEAVSNPSVVYNLSDVDHLWEITDEAYRYYLPAFLVGTLLYPDHWVFYSLPFEKMSQMLSQFSADQLDVLIAFFDFHARELAKETLVFGKDPFLEAIEDMQLRLMLRRDEL